MKTILLSLALFAAIFMFRLGHRVNAQQAAVPAPPGFSFGTGEGPINKTNRSIPKFFTDSDTLFNLKDSYRQCKTFCVRRSVKTWTDEDWKLFTQLWNELNNKGYLYDIQRMHALDCNPLVDNKCAFHFDKGFFPWHRFYISHLEQTLQKVDHEINPGRAQKNGEFCLGYWDWGYQETFNNNLADEVYKYVFGPQAIGTLPPTVGDNISKNIPDSDLKNLRIPKTGPGNYTVRAPALGNNGWTSAIVSNCLSKKNVEANNNASEGLRPCIELGPHVAIHTFLGGTISNLQWSAGDPAFFLHHTMIDYIWWIWQHYQDSYYPSDWNDQVPQPYNQWQLEDAKDYQRFCFDYAPDGEVTQQYNKTTNLTYSSLPTCHQESIQRVLTQGQPSAIPREQATFLSHAPTKEMQDQLYNSHLATISSAQTQYKTITGYYGKSNQASPTSQDQSAHQDSSSNDSSSTQSESDISSYLQYMSGTITRS